MTPAEHARAFADALLGEHGELLSGLKLTVTALMSGEPRTRWVAAEPSAVASAALDCDAEPGVAGVYLGVGLTRGPSTDERGRAARRLTVADTAGLGWLWADIDIASYAHAAKPYPPGQAEAVAVLLDTGLPPTVIVHSGHGVQAHWRLADPWIFGQVDADDDGRPVVDPDRVEAERASAVELAWAWTTSLRIRARRLGGWYTDPTSDLARLVRLPGTHNRKREPHRLAAVLKAEPSRRFDVDDVRAALAPETLLRPYRYPAGQGVVTLEGVDLGGSWAAVRAAPGRVPEWLTEVVESGFDPILSRIWSGAADADYSHDDSSVDMALAAALLRNDLDATHAVEAIMARRLRIGRRVEKVDPAQRAAYYLERTVGRVQARLQAGEARVAAAREQIATAVAEHGAGERCKETADSLYVGGRNARELASDTESVGDEPGEVEDEPGFEPPPDPDEVADPPEDLGDEPEPAEPEPVADPVPLRSLRVTEHEADPRTELADAPREPVQGLQGPHPGPPDEAETAYAAQVAAALGLPEGFAVWGAQQRKLSEGRQMRVWFTRDSTAAVVRPAEWPAGRLRATDWRPKRDFDTTAGIGAVLRHDLDIFAAVPREWPRQGLPLLYRLLRTVREATPAEFVRLALLGVLGPRSAAGSLWFDTARQTGDPYVVPGAGPPEVWVPVLAVLHAAKQLGYSPGARAMLDILADLDCKTASGLVVIEGHRTVRDSGQWACPPAELGDEQLWAEVVARARERDAADAERASDVRRIGSGGEGA